MKSPYLRLRISKTAYFTERANGLWKNTFYGTYGMARKRCEIYRIKEINEPYTEEVKARISGIQPKDYTRMGFCYSPPLSYSKRD